MQRADSAALLEPGPSPDGVRIGVHHHPQTLGFHRVRFYFEAQVAHKLARGLPWPRIHIDGDMAHGLRIWCGPDGGLAPIKQATGSWQVALPVRRVRARENVTASRSVSWVWDEDDTGPVILIPRPPDCFVPAEIINKLPNTQVDADTRLERADKRLKRDLVKLFQDAPEIEPDNPRIEALPDGTGLDDGVPIDPPAPTPAPDLLAIPHDHEEPPPDVADLREAIGMVNELVDRLGDNIALFVDGAGRLHAKRRVISYIDL
jgi:hypothetical protein